MARKFLTLAFLFFPTIVSAQIDTVRDLLKAIASLIALLIPIAYGLALLFFLWGVAKFIFKAGDEDAQKEGKNLMIWGIVGLFVITSIWGIVSFFQRDLGVTGPIQPNPPPGQMITPDLQPPPFENV